MKRLIGVLVALSLVVSLTACSKAKESAEQTTDVVVVGSGGAGLAAAIEAYDAGASVIVVEKMPIAGGNTTRATGGMNASNTKFQEAEGIKDTNETFYQDTMKGGYDKNDPDLVKYMTENSASAIDWLDSLDITLSSISTSGGQSVKRTHRPADGSAVGDYLIAGMLKQIEKRNIEIQYNTKATKIVTDSDGVVTGVEVVKNKDGKEVTETIKAKAVVMTTGGFGADFETIEKYHPEFKDFVTTNHAGATGDGIKMISDIGGALVDMEEIQIHPTVEQKTSSLITEATRGDGGILVSQSGKRFTNELLTRDKVSAAIIALPEKYAYIIFNQEIVDGSKAIAKYTKQDYTFSGETVEALAEKLAVDATTLKATIDTWNNAVKSKDDRDFNRTTGMDTSLEQGPYYAIKIAPGVHHTMGGVKINTNTEVLKEDGSIIKALYAAGELTGGVHGGNRLGGNAVTDIVVFGRQAGKAAGNYAMANGGVGHKAGESNTSSDTDKIKEGVKAQFKDGQYTAEVDGHNGKITVTATVKDGYITEITTENEETKTIFGGVEDNLITAIIYNQSTDVDVVAGATVSSEAVIEAMKDIFAQAKQ